MNAITPVSGYLGIDAGTQGLSVVFVNRDLQVLATGEAGYEMIEGLGEGCYEQNPGDWVSALSKAMGKLRNVMDERHEALDVVGIGISGQMHGEVLADSNGNSLGPARLWCDSRNELEGSELTERFGVKMPKRITAARWLWTIRNRSDLAQKVAHITTPAGWIAYRLTGQWNLGIGDAAGMFPIDQQTLDYDTNLLAMFDELVSQTQMPPLHSLLPAVRCAGCDGGTLNDEGAQILGLPAGIAVAPAEGDQPAALAGSLIGEAGMVSVSFGTSVCANSVGDRAFQGVSDAVDHFCAPDGKPINMVWLRNGTTFMNTVVEMFGKAAGNDGSAGFESVMPMLLAAEDDCGGILALPFMDDEPGLQVSRGGTAMVIGLNGENATPGNVAKAALLATMFNLKLGSEVLDRQKFPRTQLVLSGGLTRTPELGQLLADVFATPVKLLASAEEGTAWGAAIMAKYRHAVIQGDDLDWSQFLARHAKGDHRQFVPESQSAELLQKVYGRYKRLVESHAAFEKSMTP